MTTPRKPGAAAIAQRISNIEEDIKQIKETLTELLNRVPLETKTMPISVSHIEHSINEIKATVGLKKATSGSKKAGTKAASSVNANSEIGKMQKPPNSCYHFFSQEWNRDRSNVIANMFGGDEEQIITYLTEHCEKIAGTSDTGLDAYKPTIAKNAAWKVAKLESNAGILSVINTKFEQAKAKFNQENAKPAIKETI